MRTYKLLERPPHIPENEIKVGDTVYPCSKCTYGVVGDDERAFGVPCIAITADPDGGYPFYVVKESQVERLS